MRLKNLEFKTNISSYLRDLVDEGKIKDFGTKPFEYWQGVPYIELNNGKEVVLATTFYYRNNLCIKTIWDYSTLKYAKEKIIHTIESEVFG